jgi:hypothetical protein
MYQHLEVKSDQQPLTPKGLNAQELFIEDSKIIALIAMPSESPFRKAYIDCREKQLGGVILTDEEARIEAVIQLKEIIEMSKVFPKNKKMLLKSHVYKARFDDEIKEILGDSAKEYNF